MFISPGSIGSGFIRSSAGQYLLDQVTGAGAAYSLRKLRTSYFGSAIRVRRSSDNAESDIGFDSSGNLNTTALLAHVGAGNGFVVTWYDQSGNNRNISHSTTTAQPRIVNAGVIDTQNNKPSILFNGTSQYLFNSSPFLYAAGSASFVTVLRQAATTNRIICSEGSSSSANPSYRVMGTDGATGSNIQFAVINDAASSQINSVLSGTTGTYNGTLNQIDVIDTGSDATGYLNAVPGTTSSYTRSGTLTLDRFAIGCVIRPVPGGFFNGSISEVLIYPTVLSTQNRQALEASQRTYYGTPDTVLDRVTGAAAFALRKLSTSYAGSAIRVRRSNDDAEADIGFFGSTLDTVALLAHVGANSGYVTTWYDQSGNGRDATQSTTANQPRIVNAGTVETRNGKPSLFFDGSNDQLATASFQAFADGYTAISAAQSTAATGNPTIVTKCTTSRGNPFDCFLNSSDYQYRLYSSNGSANTTQALLWNKFLPNMALATYSHATEKDTTQTNRGKNVNGWCNGKFNGFRTGTPDYVDGNVPVVIGARTDGANRLTGYISEVLLFGSYLSEANRKDVENNQIGALGIYNVELFAFCGDSITNGYNATLGQDWPNVFKGSIAGNNWHINCGINGDYLAGNGTANMYTRSTSINTTDANATNGYNVFNQDGLTNATLFPWAGTNDMTLGGQTPATVYANLKTYLAAAKASGRFKRIVLPTCLPRANETETAKMRTYNDLLRTGWGSGTGELATTYGVTHFMDTETVTEFDTSPGAAKYNDATYFAQLLPDAVTTDKTHPTAAGHALIAALAKTTLGL